MRKIIKKLTNKNSVKVKLISPYELASRAYKVAPFTSIILLKQERLGN